MTKYIVFGAAIVIGILCAALWLLKGENDRLHEDLAIERVNVVTLQADVASRDEAIQQLEVQRVRDEFELSRIQDEMNDIDRSRAEAEQRYDKLRSTLDAETIDRPAVVARAARIAIGGSMRDAQCATDRESCDDGDAAADPAETEPGVRAGDAPAGGDDVFHSPPVE